MKTKQTKISFSVGKNFSVDQDAGVLRKLSLMTGDREAKGHGIYIDARTLETGLEVIQARGGKLKGAVRHPSIMDLVKTGGDRVMDIPGYFSGVAIKGNQLVAETFTFYETFKRDEPKAFERILEMATETPELFGLSVEVYGFGVYIDADGKEYSQMPKDEDGDPEDLGWQHDGMPVLRITDMSAAAFVDEPAANDGLFARLSRMLGSGKRGEIEELREVGQGLLRWLEKGGAGDDSVYTGSHKQGTSPNKNEDEITMNKTLEKIREQFSGQDNEEKFTRAMAIFGRKGPDVEFSVIEAEMNSTELSSLKKEVTQLKADLKKAEEDRDDWKQKFETLKESGHEDGLDLGAGGGEGGAPELNPYAPKTRNFTAQVLLEKQNPQKAAQLRKAAGLN